MAKNKANELQKSVVETAKLGVTSIIGQGLVGGLSSKVPGSKQSAGSINKALQLTNVGQFVKTSKKII